MSSHNKIPKCRIVVDAMGGDYAPQNAVVGAVNALNEMNDFELFLVGEKKIILEVLKKNNLAFPLEKIIEADQVIEMGDNPSDAMKTKKNSSIVVGCKFVADGNAEAFVSAGNTGAVVMASTLLMGRIKGVERPTIGTFIPNQTGVTTLFDVGAFVDSKPLHLLSFGIMSSIFVSEIYGINKPTVGLLSVGEEEEKGGKTIKEAFDLLKNSKLNFVGNVEGKDILLGKTNIVLCDGFVGNILLKFGEAVPKLLKHLLKSYAEKSVLNKIKVGLSRNTLRKALLPLDYQQYGGVPLLGVKAISIIGHGSSSDLAIKNMVFRAKEMVVKDLVTKIQNSIDSYC